MPCGLFAIACKVNGLGAGLPLMELWEGRLVSGRNASFASDIGA